MKKTIIIATITIIGLLAALLPARASITWAGSGLTVNAGTQTNVPLSLVQVGTFSFTSPNLFIQSYTGPGGTNVYVSPRLTFDGTNLFVIPQQYQFPGYPTNAGPVTLTNATFPVYAVLNITNGLGTNITVNITSP